MARLANSRSHVAAAALLLAAALIPGLPGANAMGVDRELPAATEFPVRWSATIGLETLGDLEKRLSRRLWDSTGIVLSKNWCHVGADKAPERRAIKAAEAVGQSWHTWHDGRGRHLRTVTRTSDGGAVFHWAAARGRLDILARGDFDSDGVKNLLLRLSDWPGYGHTMRAKTCLMTRANGAATLTLLSPPEER